MDLDALKALAAPANAAKYTAADCAVYAALRSAYCAACHIIGALPPEEAATIRFALSASGALSVLGRAR